MRRSQAIAMAALAGVLSAAAGCERLEEWLVGAPPAETASETGRTSFAYAADEDLSGYYLPAEAAQAGRWRLDHLFLGQATDFEAWAAGRRAGVFAPVMLEFVDPDSPMVQTELGPVRSGRIRVLPERFEVTDDRVVFEGRADGVGDVRFEGRLDLDALTAARRTLGDDRVVLTGTLTAGGRAIPVGFRWWAGD